MSTSAWVLQGSRSASISDTLVGTHTTAWEVGVEGYSSNGHSGMGIQLESRMMQPTSRYVLKDGF